MTWLSSKLGLQSICDRVESWSANCMLLRWHYAPDRAVHLLQLATDADGYIATVPGTTETSVPGVFAAGDVQDKKWRQAITAAGTGDALSWIRCALLLGTTDMAGSYEHHSTLSLSREICLVHRPRLSICVRQSSDTLWQQLLSSTRS